ncbi:hypothetical protein OESDEN_07625 [Oesophagostomum dentatum]|uniref:60Kd inner membrane protein n=1 Tax=Oesophagostomum dentatum TaxID=61180 RepID=A0A0B1T4H8_OESDE|nr:hypothetical protein OESDEN_07625 [Oesophagostomum dentatum]
MPRISLLKKLSQHYKVELAPNATRTKLELQTNDPKIIAHSEKLLAEMVPQYLAEHGLQATRIQNLKMCTIPLWIFSSFAVRNVISSDFHPSIAGGLWIPDMLAPDPYFILPVAVGLFGFLNLYSQRKIYPMAMKTWKTKSYDFCLAFFTCFAVTIMCQLPACIPLYWLSVSISGFVQAQLLRHPSIKKLLGMLTAFIGAEPFKIISQRHQSTLPPAIGNLFLYASDCYITQGLQFGMECTFSYLASQKFKRNPAFIALHGLGMSWPAVFIASGLALRVASSPLHILAEKLFARRLHAQNFFTEGILKKLSQHYKVELVPNATRTKLELQTNDPKIIAHSEKLVCYSKSQLDGSSSREDFIAFADLLAMFFTPISVSRNGSSVSR